MGTDKLALLAHLQYTMQFSTIAMAARMPSREKGDDGYTRGEARLQAGSGIAVRSIAILLPQVPTVAMSLVKR